MSMLQIEDVAKQYRLHKNWFMGHEIIKAVDGISLTIHEGETFGIVGESGCGKSTLARILAMLEPMTRGCIRFNGQNIETLNLMERRKLRRDIQIVFQEAASLNPRFDIHETLAEPLRNFALVQQTELEGKIRETLELVKLPASVLSRYPGELSGGERQRVCIARTLIIRPRFLILDEATSGLDVIIQRQILDELLRLKSELNLTYLFITHNLQVAQFITDRIGVMYKGKIVEIINSKELSAACHPYTQGMLAAIPVQHPSYRKVRQLVPMDNQKMIGIGGCQFYPRCQVAHDICSVSEPSLVAAKHGGRVACHIQ